MNIPLIIGGSLGSVVILLFILIAALDDLRTAFVVMGSTLAFCIVIGGLVAFWFWMGGAFA